MWVMDASPRYKPIRPVYFLQLNLIASNGYNIQSAKVPFSEIISDHIMNNVLFQGTGWLLGMLLHVCMCVYDLQS